MSKFNEEAITKAKQAKSVEELLTLAKESGVEMTAEQAQEYYTQLNPKSGELSDDELDNVAGGVVEQVYKVGQPEATEGGTCDLWICFFCGHRKIHILLGDRCPSCKNFLANCFHCRYFVSNHGETYSGWSCSNPSYIQ